MDPGYQENLRFSRENLMFSKSRDNTEFEFIIYLAGMKLNNFINYKNYKFYG
jgi:hypothetical protein